MTQTACAAGVPADVRTWGRWEREGEIPAFHTACRIGLMLDVNLFYLAGMIEQPEKGIVLEADVKEMVKLYLALTPQERAAMRETMREFSAMGKRIAKA
jgi:hypothetical protein